MTTGSNVEKGTEYEKFVQAIYQAVLRAEGVENISVQHDIELTGNSGCSHQIDVYWEFRLAGQTYKTAIECKAFNQDITIGRVRDFYGVLVDIPRLNGIFATLRGYQRGAKCYAKYYGISLQEVRVPNASDWEGLIKDIHIKIHIITKRITNIAVRVSRALPGQEMKFEWGAMTDVPFIFDRSGDVKISYRDLEQRLPCGTTTAINQKYFVALPGHVLKIPGTDLEIEGVDITYDVNIDSVTTSLLGQELTRAVIKDVESGTLKFIDKTGSVRSPTNH